jgi:hypothetical protein
MVANIRQSRALLVSVIERSFLVRFSILKEIQHYLSLHLAHFIHFTTQYFPHYRTSSGFLPGGVRNLLTLKSIPLVHFDILYMQR